MWGSISETPKLTNVRSYQPLQTASARCSEIQSIFPDPWKLSACNLVSWHLCKAGCNWQAAPKSSLVEGKQTQGVMMEVRAPSLFLQHNIWPPAPGGRGINGAMKKHSRLCTCQGSSEWVLQFCSEEPCLCILQALRGPAISPIQVAWTLGQCQCLQKHREAFFTAALVMTSYTAATSQHPSPEKCVFIFKDLSTDYIWILICFRNRKCWKLSYPAGSNAEGWTERNRGVPRKTEGAKKKGEELEKCWNRLGQWPMLMTCLQP